MSVTIRAATEADLEGIRAIYNECVENSTATYDVEPRTADEQHAWLIDKRLKGYPVLVAEESGRLVGWAALGEFRGRHGYRFTAEDSVYVDASCRGQGIGRRLLDALIEQGRKRGYHALIAGIDAQGAASRRLHAAAGFVEVGYMREVGYKFDRWLDVVFMELLL